MTRFPEFNASDFVALDLDGDGFLSLIELQGNSSEEGMQMRLWTLLLSYGTYPCGYCQAQAG